MTTPPPKSKAESFHDSLLEGVRTRSDRAMFKSVEWAEDKTKQSLKALTLAYGMCFGFMFTFFVICLSYWLIYYLIMPVMRHESQLFFDFDPLRNGNPLVCNNDTTTELPIAQVILSHSDQQWTSIQDQKSGPPKHVVDPRLPLPSGELYDIWIQLSLPESFHNLQQGPTMVQTELIYMHPKNSSQSKLLAMSRRPLMIPYVTYYSRLVNDIFMIPLRALGFFQPIYYSSMKVIEMWQEDGDLKRVPSAVTVTLSNPHLHVESARMYFLVQLFGFRYYMYYWPILSFLLYVTLMTSVGFATLFAALMRRVMNGVEDEQQEQLDIIERTSLLRGNSNQDEDPLQNDEETDEDDS